MEKRSRRRTRDLVTQAASQGLSENEIGCARISMMARSTNAPCKGRIQMRKTTPSIYSNSACNARPVHTDGVISGSGEPFAKSPFIPQQRTSRPPCIAGVRSARSARCSGRCQERSQFSRVSCRRRTAVSRAAQSSIGIDTVRKRTIIRTVDSWGASKIMAKSHLKLVAPTTEKRTVTPTRRPNAEIRTREYLTEAEVERLTEAAKGNR